MMSPTPHVSLARCGGCGAAASEQRPLRRGRCAACYNAWISSRPVGIGAVCATCDDRRLPHLRHFELMVRSNAPGGRWVVLCHNCAADAERLDPPARSIDALKMRIARDRRFGDRRSLLALTGTAPPPEVTRVERRRGERRALIGNIFDDEVLEEIVIEMEADYEEVTDDQICSEEVTGIYRLLPEDAANASQAIQAALERH